MLTFAQPLFLLALFGLAIPVLAHLINRKRAQVLRFPSIRFIHKARLPQEGRRNLKDWILLLLRLLLYSAIILVLAGPRWVEREGAGVTADREAENIVIVLDLSAGMTGWDAWPEARDRALEIVDGQDPATRVGLIFFDREVRMALPPDTGREMIRDFLHGANPVPYRGNPEPALLEAAALLEESGPRKLILISNFQRTRWQPTRLPRLDPEIALEFVPVGNFELPNVAIMDARAFPSREGEARVFAQVRNFSGEEVHTVLSLESGDDSHEEELSLAPGETGQAVFTLTGVASEKGRLSLPGDAYGWDNAYYLWLGAPPPTRVLTLFPFEEEPEKALEFDFVRRALEARTRSDVHAFVVLGGDVSMSPDSAEVRHRVLYLPGSASYLSEEQWDELGTFLEEGGLVLMTPGRNPARAFRELRERGWSGSDYIRQTGRQRDFRNPFRIEWVNPASNLGEVFDDESIRDLYLAEIYHYVRVRPGEKTEVLLRLEGGDPLLLREPVGRGQLIFSAVPLDSASSDLPLRNAYLPVLRELLVDALPRDGGVVRLDCGESFPLALLPTGSDPADPMLDELSMEPAVFEWMGLPVQVNVSRQESWPERLALSELRSALHGGSGMRALSGTADRMPEGKDLWPWLALGALLFFIAENLLAQRMKP